MRIFQIKLGGGVQSGDTAVLFYESKRGGRTETGVRIGKDSTAESVSIELATGISRHFCSGLFQVRAKNGAVTVIAENAADDVVFGTTIEHGEGYEASDDDGAETGFVITEI